MNDYLKEKEITWFKIIGYYEIVGGIIGLIACITVLSNVTKFSEASFLFIAFLVFTFSIYAGFNLTKIKNYKYSIVTQAVQILFIKALGLTYEIFMGTSLGLGIEWIEEAKLIVRYEIMSGFLFQYNPENVADIKIVINVIPIIIISYLVKVNEKIQIRKKLAE